MANTGTNSSTLGKSREEEVLGWTGYLDELSSCAAGGSLEFSVEIQHSSTYQVPLDGAL